MHHDESFNYCILFYRDNPYFMPHDHPAGDGHAHGAQEQSHHGHAHDTDTHHHGAYEALEPLAYTIYTKKTELFVEFKPLVVGETSKFAAHFTILGEKFLPLDNGTVNVSWVSEKNTDQNKANEPSTPGIFRLGLTPETAGMGKLTFHIQANNFTDTVIIEQIAVYSNPAEAAKVKAKDEIGEEITYLKEQAWQVEFAHAQIKKKHFTEVIKTTGEILPAQGDEVILTAKNSGIITFRNKKKMSGSAVAAGENLFTISGKGLIENNLDAKYHTAKTNFEKAQTDLERAKELVKDNIISQTEFQNRQLHYETTKITFNNIANSYSPKDK